MSEENNTHEQGDNAHEEQHEETQAPSSNDPLDAIEDTNALKVIASQYGAKDDELTDDKDELLATAKKYRSISQRKAKAPKEETPKEEPKGDYVSRKELQLTNTKRAKNLVKDSENDADKDIFDNWEDIMDYVPKSASLDTEYDIVDAMRTAHAAYRFKNPLESNEDAGADLQKTTAPQGKSAVQTPVKKSVDDDLPNFDKRPKTPDQWYQTNK